MRREWSSCILLLIFSAVSRGEDWPGWLGASRDSVWRETGILDKFPEGGPKVLWRTPVAGGYAGPAVAGGKVYVHDYEATGDVSANPGARSDRQGKERVLCLDAKTGKEIWRHEHDVPYKISYAYGPRCTPTVSGGKVYTLGAEGLLCCLDAEQGDELWSKDLKAEYKTTTPIWGFAGHPLVDGQKLICLVGGPGSVVVTFDRDTGQELWRALSANPDAGYCPPKIIEAGGKRQLLVWHPQALNSLNPETGEVYWTEKLEPHPQPEAALGFSTRNAAPPSDSTKSTLQPRTRSRLIASTTSLTPAVSATVSSSSIASAKPNLYWNPEQPPPSTLSRRIAGLCVFSAIAATRAAAAGVSEISACSVMQRR